MNRNPLIRLCFSLFIGIAASLSAVAQAAASHGVEALITRSAPKPSVAPASDKRPALAIKPVHEEFPNLEEAGDLA